MEKHRFSYARSREAAALLAEYGADITVLDPQSALRKYLEELKEKNKDLYKDLDFEMIEGVKNEVTREQPSSTRNILKIIQNLDVSPELGDAKQEIPVESSSITKVFAHALEKITYLLFLPHPKPSEKIQVRPDLPILEKAQPESSSLKR
jgi:hypothetical protein